MYGLRAVPNGLLLASEDCCVIHFDIKAGDVRVLLAVTLNKLLERREEWLSLSVDYGKFSEVARKSLEFIPTDTATILENLGPLYSHVSCYRLFTDVEKLRRAKKPRINDQAEREISTNNDFRQRSARNGSITSTLSKRSKRDVLPSFCLICKVPGPI